MKSFVAITLLALLLLLISYALSSGKAYAPVTEQTATAPVTKEVASLQFEIVRTQEAQARGLSGRTDVPHGYGMLFVFSTPDTYSFWMKDMLVPIDILWLSDDGTILGLEDSVAPSSYPDTSFTAPSPVRLVLELRAGEARLRGLSIGQRVALPAGWQK